MSGHELLQALRSGDSDEHVVRGRFLSLELLRAEQNVVIEWGVWAREERDALRNAARKIDARLELHNLTAPTDELWKRIAKRDLEGRCPSTHSVKVRI